MITLQKFFIILFFYFFAFLLVANPQDIYAQKGKKKKKSKKTTQLSEKEELIFEKYFFDGIVEKMKKSEDEAIIAFNECLKINPKSDAVFYELAQIYFEQNNKEQSLNYAEQAAELVPDNKWYQLLYSEALAINHRFADAAKGYEKLVELSPNEYEYYFDLGYMYIQAGEFENAIKTYDKLEDKVGIVEDIVLQKQKLYVRINKLDKAAAELEKLIENDPKNPMHYLSLGELYEANNMSEKAFEVYRKLVEIDPENPYGHIVMAEYYEEKGDKAKAYEELKAAFAQPALPLQVKAEKIVDYMKNGKSKEQTFELLDLAQKAHPKEALIHIIRGDLLYNYGDKQGALEQMLQSVTIESNNFEVWHQIMLINFELRNFEELAKQSKNVTELFPNNATAYYFNGLAYAQLRQHEKAIKPLKRGAMINTNSSNTDLTAQMYSLLGECYNSLKKYQESDKSYEKALKLNGNDPTIFNNYGYFLSLRGENLEKAASMAKKANQIAPGNASYQDTYGWVLYQQANYKDAKVWLEKSVASNGDSGVVLEHYGDVLFKLGKVNEAVEQWEKAKKAGGASENLDKKIQNRQVYE
ncbi:MAG: tetratricopeptide repeat protein [Chitinophagales bacterium]